MVDITVGCYPHPHFYFPNVQLLNFYSSEIFAPIIRISLTNDH